MKSYKIQPSWSCHSSSETDNSKQNVLSAVKDKKKQGKDKSGWSGQKRRSWGRGCSRQKEQQVHHPLVRKELREF